MDKFYKLIIHRDHLLLIDWMLNHVNEHTNMNFSLQLSKELKEVTSQALRNAPKIYEYEVDDDL